MVVKNREELIRLIREGWTPYYHARVKRWYLRKGKERILIDRELDDIAEELARDVKGGKKKLEEERIEASGEPSSQALGEEVSKPIYYGALGLKEREVFEGEGKPSTPARVEESESPEVVSSQPVFDVVIPVEYDPVYDPSNVMRRMEDVWVSSIPVLPPPFPPVRPPRFFRRRVGVKCQRCGFVLSVEVPDDLPSVKEVMCKNCMALIRVHFKWG